MVTCFKQYNEFVKVMEKTSVWDLVIINKFILNQLCKEGNVSMIQKISKTWVPALYLYYLYKYGLISFDVFNLFKPDILPEDVITSIYVIDYFYFKKNKNLSKLFRYVEKSSVLSHILNRYGRDINIVKYVANHFIEESFSDYCTETIKEHLNFDNTDLFYFKDQKDETIQGLSQSSFNSFQSIFNTDFNLMHEKFQEQCETFRDTYLSSTERIDEILKDPKFILDRFVKEDFIHYPLRIMFCICYVVSLIHNGTPPFLVYLFTSLLESQNIMVDIKDNKIIFHNKFRGGGDEEFRPEAMLYGLCKNTSNETFNGYFEETFV